VRSSPIRPTSRPLSGANASRNSAKALTTADAAVNPTSKLRANASRFEPGYINQVGIAGLEAAHYGWSFGCMFERCGAPYRVDYAAMARVFEPAAVG